MTRVAKELKQIEENKKRVVDALRDLALRIEADEARLVRISSTTDGVRAELQVEYVHTAPLFGLT